MRALLISGYAPAEPVAASVRLDSFAAAFAQHFTVTYVTTAPISDDPCHRPYEVHSLGVWAENSRQNLLQRTVRQGLASARLFLYLLSASAHFLLVSSPPLALAIAVVAAGAVRGKKVVLDVRDPYPDALFAAGVIRPESGLGRFFRSIERWLYRSSDIVITVTPSLVGTLRGRARHTPVVFVPNGVDTGLFRSRAPGRRDTIHVVTHGRIGRLQNTAFLIELACAARERQIAMRMSIIGTGPGREALENALRDSGLDEMVDVVGPVPHHDLPAILRTADFGVSARAQDSLSRHAYPVRLFEQMACGLPVVVSPHGEASDLVAAHSAGAAFGAGEATDALEWLVTVHANPELYFRFSQNARNLAASFCRSDIAAKLSRQMAELLGAKHRAGGN